MDGELSIPCAHDGAVTLVCLALTELEGGRSGVGYEAYATADSLHGAQGGGGGEAGFEETILTGGADCVAKLWKLKLTGERKREGESKGGMSFDFPHTQSLILKHHTH